MEHLQDFSPLRPWLNRMRSLPSFQYFRDNQPNFELGGFLTLDFCMPLHETITAPAQSLSNSWQRTKDYVEVAIDLIGSDDESGGGWLDRDEVEIIYDNLGDPPLACYPIYLITIYNDDDDEKIVYVGKTSAKRGRFAGGHAAAIKLHNPKFDGYKKRVYFACVTLLTKEEYFPLEWVHPLEESKKILDDIETKLIQSYNPVLNKMKKKKINIKYDPYLHIQNFTKETNFLNDKFI